MSAFRRAVNLGADAIEFDVQPTRDGHLVVLHDLSLERTRTGAVHCSRLGSTRFAVSTQARGSVPHTRGSRCRRLSEVLALDDIEFELELKGYGESFVVDVLDLVKAAGVLKRVEFTASNVALLALMKRREPSAVIGLFSSPQTAWMSDAVFEHHVIGVAETSGADVVHVHARSITQHIVERLHGHGKIAHANDAADAAELHRALESGADRVSTHHVRMATEIIRTAERAADL